MCAHSTNWSANPRPGSETSLKGQRTCVFQMTSSLTYSAKHVCVCAHSSNCRDPQVAFSETHVCMPAAAIGRPTVGPWVQPSLATSSATHMCVCARSAIGLPKLLNVQSPQVISSLTYSATHMCVCAHRSTWLASPPLISSAPHMCVQQTYSGHTCVCSQQQSVGQPLTLGRSPHSTYYSATHCCVLTAAIGLPKLLNVQSPQMTSSLTYSAKHLCVCVLTTAIGRPTLGQGQKPP